MTLPCISLWQPFASLIAIGAKRVETRSWSTSYRGEIAIHAAKRWTKEEEALCASYPPFFLALKGTINWANGLKPHPEPPLPLGAIVAVATLESVFRTTKIAGRIYAGPVTVPYTEIPFGDFTEGRYAWLLFDIRRLPAPVPCKGAQQIWTAPPDVESAVRKQLGEAPHA